VRWFRSAAELGDRNAQFNLASLLAAGKGADRDTTEAALWYRRAAESGHALAQGRLGYLYAQGDGVERDRVEAFAWLTLASRHGIGYALKALEEVVQAMSVDERRAGSALVASKSRPREHGGVRPESAAHG